MKTLIVTAAALAAASGVAESHAADVFLGHWALDCPGGRAGWLEVTQQDNYLDARLLWIGGSVTPVDSAFIVDDNLIVTRLHRRERKDASGQTVRVHMLPETFAIQREGDGIKGTRMFPAETGLGLHTETFTGKREPAMPPAPGLARVRFGDPIDLLANGMGDWEPMEPGARNAWSVADGVLDNAAVQPEGGPHISFGNLRTKDTFEDFELSLEVNVPKDGNSGVYLRGIYEVQVADTYGRDTDSHHMGAIYSRITPSVAAEKPADEWQSMVMTLVDRHVTVVLNGTTIIDNAPLHGCTGGAMTSDVTVPGPIFLQGDHGPVKYRNITLRPVVGRE